MSIKTERLFGGLKSLVFIACLGPFALLSWGTFYDQLGANPVETVIHRSGDWTLRMLLITLFITPLRRFSGWRWPLRLRRMLGLFTFFYASLHFLAWSWLDQHWQFAQMLADIAERPYITVGFGAWLLLWPLAITSNRWSMRRLGRHWSRLHRAVYLIGLLGVAHYAWLVKADLLQPLVYGVILTVLLAVRIDLDRLGALFARSANEKAAGDR